MPFSYLDQNQQPIGYSIDLCMKIVDAVEEELDRRRQNPVPKPQPMPEPEPEPVREVVKLDPNLPLYAIATPATIIEEDTVANRVIANIFKIFGAVAVFLASVGIYGIMSFSVNQRIMEFGIRSALKKSLHAPKLPDRQRLGIARGNMHSVKTTNWPERKLTTRPLRAIALPRQFSLRNVRYYPA